MLYVLYAIFFISCVVLIGSVLLQPGKTDAGALFTSNVSSTAFAPRGTASVLAKFTIGAAVVFMLSALMISMPALSGNVSVVSSAEAVEATPTPTPAAEASTVNQAQPENAAPAPGQEAPPANAAPAQEAPPANAAPAQNAPPANQ